MNEGTDTKPLDPHGIGGDSTDSAAGEAQGFTTDSDSIELSEV